MVGVERLRHDRTQRPLHRPPGRGHRHRAGLDRRHLGHGQRHGLAAATGTPITVTPPVTAGGQPTFGATAAYKVISTRKKQFRAAITIKNTGTTTIDNWTLQFQFKPRITSIQDAILVSYSHGNDVIENAGDNSAVGPGQSVTFGIVGRAGRTSAAPTNEVLNGIAIGGTTATPKRNRKRKQGRD